MTRRMSHHSTCSAICNCQEETSKCAIVSLSVYALNFEFFPVFFQTCVDCVASSLCTKSLDSEVDDTFRLVLGF